MKRILHDELPDDNYCVLKYVISFLVEVCAERDRREWQLNERELILLVNTNPG